MKGIFQLRKSIYRFSHIKKGPVYEIHGGNFTGCSKVGSSRVGVRKFRDNFSSVIHSQKENLVELALGNFHNLYARLRSDGTGGETTELQQIEFDVAGGKLFSFVPEPSA
jgi:hypothetical protein